MTFGDPTGRNGSLTRTSAPPPQGSLRPRPQHLGHGQHLLQRRQRRDHRQAIKKYSRSRATSSSSSPNATAAWAKHPRSAKSTAKQSTASKDYVNHGGLSRAAIFQAVNASLERLGHRLHRPLQIHRFDPNVPIEETMEALHDLVQSGQSALHRRQQHVGLPVRA